MATPGALEQLPRPAYLHKDVPKVQEWLVTVAISQQQWQTPACPLCLNIALPTAQSSTCTTFITSNYWAEKDSKSSFCALRSSIAMVTEPKPFTRDVLCRGRCVWVWFVQGVAVLATLPCIASGWGIVRHILHIYWANTDPDTEWRERKYQTQSLHIHITGKLVLHQNPSSFPSENVTEFTTENVLKWLDSRNCKEFTNP